MLQIFALGCGDYEWIVIVTEEYFEQMLRDKDLKCCNMPAELRKLVQTTYAKNDIEKGYVRRIEMVEPKKGNLMGPLLFYYII